MVEFVIKIATIEYLRCVFAFVNDGVHSRLEGELDILGKVVFDIYITVPCEVLAEGEVHIVNCTTCEVAHFHMRESTMHIGAECPRLW